MVLAAGICLGALPSPTAGQTVRYTPVKGRVTVEGTSNLDTWRVESKSVAGYFEAVSGFGMRDQKASPGPLDGRAEVTIEVRSLKSIEKDGKPFSNKMDGIMYDSLKAGDHPRIVFRLDQLRLRSAARINGESSECEARGQLAVAGVSREISMPVKVNPMGEKQLRISGNTTLKMTDFQVEPPAPKIA
jgi:polyisoprenoid-binding protein YceI